MQHRSNTATDATLELITLTKAAEQVGRHKATISRHVSKGYIPNHGSDSRPLVRLDEVQLALSEIVDSGKRQISTLRGLDGSNPGRGGTQQSELAAAKLKREELQTQILQLKLDEQAGKLIPKELAERSLFVAARTIRNRLTQLPKVIGPKLVQQDRETIRGILDESVTEILQQLPDELTVAMTDLEDIDDDDGGEEQNPE